MNKLYTLLLFCLVSSPVKAMNFQDVASRFALLRQADNVVTDILKTKTNKTIELAAGYDATIGIDSDDDEDLFTLSENELDEQVVDWNSFVFTDPTTKPEKSKPIPIAQQSKSHRTLETKETKQKCRTRPRLESKEKSKQKEEGKEIVGPLKRSNARLCLVQRTYRAQQARLGRAYRRA